MALETKRLTVRVLHEDDFQDFQEYAVDSELCRMLGWQEIQNETDARRQFNRLIYAKSYLGIICKENGKMIGNIGLGNVRQIPSLAMVLEKTSLLLILQKSILTQK